MLVGGAFVAIDGESLVDDVTGEVALLARDSMTSCWRYFEKRTRRPCREE